MIDLTPLKLDSEGRLHRPLFSRAQWFKLPLKLRQRWWRETDFSRQPPSDELASCVREFLAASEKTSSST